MPLFGSEPQNPPTAGESSLQSGPDSVDGRGGSERTGETTTPRYLYYRLYTKDGAIKSYNPIYSNDPFMGRILPKSITPPHTALSLKKHLCKIEGLAGGSNSILFESLSSDTEISDSTRLNLRSRLGAGMSYREPMALLVGVAEAEKRLGCPRVNELMENPDQHETRAIYYRVYDEEGEESSKTAFDSNDNCLGRVDTLSVAPPYTVTSLKLRIMKAEGIADKEIELFEDTDGEAIMNDADPVSFFAKTFAGCAENNPLAFVYHEPKMPVSSSAMTKAIRANIQCNPSANMMSTWHAHFAGEILHTDGIEITSHYVENDGRRSDGRIGYMAINSAGKKAFVVADRFTFC